MADITYNPDGSITINHKDRYDGKMYGDYVTIQDKEEDIKIAKELLLEQICYSIRELAASNEDFFIIKKLEDGRLTVGWKILFPTL